MKESALWASVKASVGHLAHFNRIENTAGSGISDVNACRGGREVWIELKVFKGRRLHFRNSQLGWILTRKKWGGRVWLLARRDSTMFLWDAAELLEASTRRPEAGGFSMEPSIKPTWQSSKPFRWPELVEILFSDGSQSNALDGQELVIE